jgi:3-phosphoshikimate 1-carboxyvinyltransferase
MGRIVEPLQQMGVEIAAENGCAPLRLRPSPRPLRALDVTLPVASAQVKSCLLLAALAAGGTSRLVEPGPSRDHTERMLASLGVRVVNESPADERSVYTTVLTPPAPLRLPGLHMTLPGDMSAAAFLIVAALITPGSDILLRGVGLNPTRTGLLDTLIEMGAPIDILPAEEQGGEPVGDLRVRAGALHAVTVSGERVVRMIDEFPVFAVAAAFAQGQTLVRDAEELRYKESDRISALGGELRRLGVAFTETPDGFSVRGGPVQGGLVESHGDHRLALSLAVAGLAARAPVQVHGAQMIDESFPGFPAVLRGLGGNLA